MLKSTRCILQGLLLVCIIVTPVFSVSAQIAIGQPSINIFQGACATSSFNSYDVSFSFNPSSGLDASNQFIVELSDGNGNFDDPAFEAFRSNPGAIVDSPATVSISIPEDARGDGYRLRVKSTSPVASSVPSDPFSAYFKLHDTPFTINNLEDTATFCPSSGYLLTIDDPGLDGAISPLTYNSLEFNWFRVIDDTNSQWVATGDTYLVDEEGTYFAETDYGPCSSDSFSNRVTVTFATNGEPATANISSSLGTLFCSNGEGTTLTTVNGDSYEWFRNDQLIQGANDNTLQTNDSGSYAVIVTSNGCVAVGSIDIESLSGSTMLDVNDINFIQAGESLQVSVITELDNPQYEWFFNDEIIPSATTMTYSANQVGNYKVVVTATGDCDLIVELFFELRVVVDADNIPNVISPNGDGINDTWMIPAEYLSGSNAEVLIVSSSGKKVLETKEYLNNWPEDMEQIGSGNQVFYYVITPQEKESIKGSITIIN
ncbi:gliding motility-associated C-terminal domain-containing protein [Dokdonia sp. Hel_I_53]|uniref:T9SS type B sorting domain-containing protein n=1 Tax=Dokdonia sp. Hel_I_53 TaxID=1566287 RepID=UPI00119B9101|nr:gliding motility-associated C-terminal domain-containing protein [Dokdonia sp. Hel_I_53]TVZ51928.1 gliding motility-associated-like protein [Dokdonia sp. Hel_I_53]